MLKPIFLRKKNVHTMAESSYRKNVGTSQIQYSTPHSWFWILFEVCMQILGIDIGLKAIFGLKADKRAF